MGEGRQASRQLSDASTPNFADDIVLIDVIGEQLQKLTNLVASCAKGTGLDINVDKMKYMKIGPPEAMWQMKVNGQLIECVNEFCYLGSIITDTGSCDKEDKTCIDKANLAFMTLDDTHMAPETSRTSNQNLVLRVTGVGYIAVLCQNSPSQQTGSVLKVSVITVSEEY